MISKYRSNKIMKFKNAPISDHEVNSTNYSPQQGLDY
jgi:hypothetical protein